MKRTISGGLVAAVILFMSGYTTSAAAAEYRTHIPKHVCVNTERNFLLDEFGQADETSDPLIRKLLNAGTIQCEVHRAAPLSSRGARAVIRFDTRAFPRAPTEISCRFASVNVWGREIFAKNGVSVFTSGGFRSIVIALPRTIVNGTFRITCEMPPRFYPYTNPGVLISSYQFPSFTIIEL